MVCVSVFLFDLPCNETCACVCPQARTQEELDLAKEVQALAEVSFQRKNPDFLLKNPDFLIRNPDSLLKSVEFITKHKAEVEVARL